MKENAPNLPNIYNHEYNLENKNTSNYYNQTYEQLNKDIIPICFYNHLMIRENAKNIMNKKNKYFKTSITERNKKKLLTIIYYSPK
jgi:hypothetical protein